MARFCKGGAHVLGVTSALALSTNHTLTSGGAVSSLVALGADGQGTIPNVLVGGYLTSSSRPMEYHVAEGVAVASLLSGSSHLTFSIVECELFPGEGFVSTKPADRKVLGWHFFFLRRVLDFHMVCNGVEESCGLG